MNWIKTKYQFDIGDITTLISVVAVILTVCGIWWSTIIFLVNAAFQVVWTVAKTKRYNLLLLNLSMLVFNVYFLMK